MRNGLEEYYIIKDQKKLRYGYTTGSCAAAASAAAAKMLLFDELVEMVDLMTPKGLLLHLEILNITKKEDVVSCAVKKDGGDDPDATHGLLVYATVKKSKNAGIHIEGGIGVGRVTKKGLEQPVGAAAINRTPRAMITDEVKKVAQQAGYQGGLDIVISVSEGEVTAKKTFNPRLGIVGGISILGTSGIVVPMSEEALLASIRTEMALRKENQGDYLLVTPGNYGEAFARSYPDVDVDMSVKCSNYVGETLDYAVNMGVKGILFIAHIGKFIKVSGGIMNTHSRCSDSRAELMTAAALRAGADFKTAKRLLDTITTEEALDILKETELFEATIEEILTRIHRYLQHRCQEALSTEVILFSSEHGLLGETSGAQKLLERFRR